MKIVKSSCSSKRKIRTCTFSPQVNIKNKRTAIQTEQDVNAAHSEAKIQDLIDDIRSNIYTKVKAVATSSDFGFDENEIDDYFFVEASAAEIGEDHHEAIRVEVRAEVSYEGLEDLMEALNPIIETYDSYAYFEPVEPGIIEAYVSVNQVDMSIYGATASPDHMFYDYHGKRFSVHDNSSEIGEDNIDDVYFLWKGNISQQAGAYNDADEDYVYAFIRGRGVIEYYKKGKYVATDNYTLRDEDDFEYAWEYMEIILQHICDRLIAYNKDVPDRMVYNSTSIQAADDEFHGYADVASDIESALKDGIHQFFQSDKYNWSDDQIQDKTVVDVAWAVLRDDKGVERHSLIIDVYAEANRRIIERLGRFLDQLVLSKYDSYDKFTWVDQYSIEGLVYLDEYLEDIESYTSIEASDDDEFHGYADVASSIDQDTKNCLTQFFGSAPYDWSSDDIKDRTVVDIAWAVIKDNDGYDRHSLIVDVYAEANRRTITKLGKLLDKQVLSKYESFDKFVWVDQYSIEGIVYLDLFSEDVNSSTSIESSDSYEYDGANYEFVTNIDGYWVYRAVVDGKGTWRAMPQGSDESEFSRLSFPISYDQARGFEPINEPSAITKLRKDLGKKLLPKSGQSVEATEDLSSYPEEFRNAYQKAKTEFINRYPNLGVSIIRDDPYAEDGEVAVLVKDYDTGDHAKCYLVYSVDELISSDYEWMLQAFEETAEAIGLLEDNTVYSSVESSDYESDSGIFIEDIIDSLEDNGYDLSRIRSIRQGLLELFGYKGKDADIIIHDLVAGRFIDPNDWVDKDYTPGIYSATNDGEGYWFFTTHGVQPGSVPRDVDILDIIDTPNGSFVKFNRFLSTKELNEYDMVEKAPKSVMSSKNCEYVKSSEEDEDREDLPMVDQEYDSAATSINSNKLPAIYKMVNFNEGDVVVDFGGGKFDNAVEYIRDKGATLCVYDPYNRSAEHNKEVLRILRENGGADAAVNSNVLNVIKEPEARKNVLENIARITKPGAPIYITVYEGKGDGQEGPTKSGYQLNRKTADYLEEIQEVFPDATRKGKLITAHNSNVSAATNVSNIGAKVTCSDEYNSEWIKVAQKEVPDSDGFYTDYTMYVSEDGSTYIFMFGDSDVYGPDIDYADHECSNWDEAVEWWDSYDGFEDENLKDVYSSDSIGNHMIITVNSGISGDGFSITVEDEQGDVVFNEAYRFGVNTSYDRKYAERAEEDYQNAKKYGWSRIPELKPYVGDIIDDICNEYNIQKNDIVFKRGNNVFKGSEVTDSVVNDFIDSYIVNASYSIKGSFSDLEDEYLSPPEYDDPIEHEASEELIEVEINQVITVDVDGDYEWDDDTYVWASPDGSNEEWRSEDGVYVDDKVGVVEHIDDLIIPNVPTRPGKYRVTGLAELIYDVSGIQEYRTEYGPDDYDSDIDIDHAVVSFNFRKSEVQNLKITPVRR